MGRQARQHEPGALYYIVSNFAHGASPMQSEEARANYLGRVHEVLVTTDWTPIAYALMGARIHWAAVAGSEPLHSFTKPLHVGFARWWNEAHGGFGPVFAGRPHAFALEPEMQLRLIAYVHNRPVRNGDVAVASESVLTSHRAYLGDAAPPRWLDVDAVLRSCGFDTSPSGRMAFDALVRRHVTDSFEMLRRRPRLARGTGVDQLVPQPWEGDPELIVALVALECGIDADRIRSADRSREVVDARRLAVLVGTRYLGRTLSEMAELVGIGASSASRLIRTRPERLSHLVGVAARIEKRCREMDA